MRGLEFLREALTGAAPVVTLILLARMCGAFRGSNLDSSTITTSHDSESVSDRGRFIGFDLLRVEARFLPYRLARPVAAGGMGSWRFISGAPAELRILARSSGVVAKKPGAGIVSMTALALSMRPFAARTCCSLETPRSPVNKISVGDLQPAHRRWEGAALERANGGHTGCAYLSLPHMRSILSDAQRD